MYIYIVCIYLFEIFMVTKINALFCPHRSLNMRDLMPGASWDEGGQRQEWRHGGQVVFVCFRMDVWDVDIICITYIYMQMIVYDCLWLCMIVYDCVWLYMIVYDCIWLYMIVYGCIWLELIIYDYI